MDLQSLLSGQLLGQLNNGQPTANASIVTSQRSGSNASGNGSNTPSTNSGKKTLTFKNSHLDVNKKTSEVVVRKTTSSVGGNNNNGDREREKERERQKDMTSMLNGRNYLMKKEKPATTTTTTTPSVVPSVASVTSVSALATPSVTPSDGLVQTHNAPANNAPSNPSADDSEHGETTRANTNTAASTSSISTNEKLPKGTASVRFRQKKKLKEQEMERTLAETKQLAESLQERIQQLEMENRLLRDLVVEKSHQRDTEEVERLRKKARLHVKGKD